ncbi:MAG: hypothetical protein FJ125_00680 [Deltaproteobacteria bacterium]|nr:hypothetical protein [Deltaproteobacteria bacterium]
MQEHAGQAAEGGDVQQVARLLGLDLAERPGNLGVGALGLEHDAAAAEAGVGSEGATDHPEEVGAGGRLVAGEEGAALAARCVLEALRRGTQRRFGG